MSCIKGIWAYVIGFNDNACDNIICLIVLIEWSLPLITFVIFCVWSSIILDSINVGVISDLATEKFSMFSFGIFIFPRITSLYSK